MGLLTFSINVTLDGCVDHQEGIADDETHAFFTRLMDEGGAMLWGRVTYEMMESYWPAVARRKCRAFQEGGRHRRRNRGGSPANRLHFDGFQRAGERFRTERAYLEGRGSGCRCFGPLTGRTSSLPRRSRARADHSQQS
jgi:dihydrofolate reductase